MGYKKGTQQALIDNELRRVNSLLKSTMNMYGKDSKLYENKAFQVTRLFGLDNIRFGQDGLVQIKRSSALIKELSKNSKPLQETRRMSKPSEHKKKMLDIIEKNAPEVMKKKEMREAAVKAMIELGGNNIATALHKYFKNDVKRGGEADDYAQEIESIENGRETRSLVMDEYMRRFTPVDPDLKTHNGMLYDNDTGQMLSADDAFKVVEQSFKDYESNEKYGLVK